MRTIAVMQPVADEPQPAGILATRPRDLRGLSIGFVDEGIVPATRYLLAALETQLVERAGIGRIVRAKLGGNELEIADPSGVVLDTVHTEGVPVGELSKWCAAAITGVGYWGCSVWSVQTAVGIERQAIPAATIVSQEWAPLAESSAREQGFDGLPLVVVPQSFERLTEEQATALAGEIVDDVIHALSSPADVLRAEFSDRWDTSGGVTIACNLRVSLRDH
jgi:hypothetical protein